MSACTGWQPGMQENAAEWDDDWDKFQDEGLLCSKKHVLITSFGWWMYLSFINKCLFFINKGSSQYKIEVHKKKQKQKQVQTCRSRIYRHVVCSIV